MGIKHTKSFTLIEMVIVIGVLGFALPVLFAIIFLIIQQQGRIYSLQEVKKQGDFAYNNIKTTIRQNGKTITNPTIYPTTLYPTINDVCPLNPAVMPTSAPFIFLYDKTRTSFYYLLDGTDGDKIASVSSKNGITNRFLTDENVHISNFGFSCYRTNQFSPPIITASFRVSKSSDPTSPYLDYSSRFQLKSY